MTSIIELKDGVKLAYKSTDTGVVITGVADGCPVNLAIPAEIAGRPVVGIGQEAFSDCASLTAITLPEGITKIGWRAFYGCASLETINIPTSVITVRDSAFANCPRLKNQTLPATVVNVGENVFDGD